MAAGDAEKWVDNLIVEGVDGPSRRPDEVDPVGFRRAVESLLARVDGW